MIGFSVDQTRLFQWLLESSPDELTNDPATRTKAVVLGFVLMCSFFACLLFMPIAYFGFQQSPIVFDIGFPILLSCLVNYALSGVIFFYVKSIVIAGNFALLSPYTAAVIAGWLSGGVYSPMLYLLLVPPVYAFVLTNVRSGVIWFCISMITFFVIWYIDEFDFYEPVFMISDADEYALMQLLMPVTTCVMIMIGVAIYEMNSHKLKHLLDQERNQLAYKASHDPLTGLANRAEFNTQIQLSLNNAKRLEYPLALLYIDLDGFKPINDTLGHAAGDVVLIDVAKRLRKIVRGTDVVARLGGDEFAIILQGVGSVEKAKPILDKLLASIAEDVDVGNETIVNVYASIGVAFYDYQHDNFDGDKFCERADAAMYLAKEEKNTFRLHSEVLARQSDETQLHIPS